MIENPPKLWAFLAGLDSDEPDAFYVVAEDKPITYPLPERATRPQAYVREDVAATETTALRRERDALQAVVDAVAAFTAHDFAMSGAHGVMRLVRLAKDAKTAQAGKGVG